MTRHLIAYLMLVCSISSYAQSLRLFSPETKAIVPQTKLVVMDFLERYFSELKTLHETSTQTKMADDKVYFRKGRPSDISHICDTLPFSINLHDRYYEVSWMHKNKPFVTIVFPAQYDLLLGKQKDEVMLSLKMQIFNAPSHEGLISKVDTTSLVSTNDGVQKTMGDTLGVASLSDALYYNIVGEGQIPVFDEAHPAYSAANLFHGLIANADYRMHVEQSVYGMSTIAYDLTLRQWLNYCAEWGLKAFFAIEQERQDGLLALVIAHSVELGFNHVLSVIIPHKFINDKNAVLKVRLTPFIPIHNVKNLYQQQSSKRQKIKLQ